MAEFPPKSDEALIMPGGPNAVDTGWHDCAMLEVPVEK
jgi:hypothetical protein